MEMSASDNARMLHAVTEYDKSAAKRPGHNPYFLAHACRAMGCVRQRVALGQQLRGAVITEFTGRLCDKVLKALGCPPMTRDEAKFGLAVRLPALPDDEDDAE